MTDVADLELPVFDYYDPSLHGERFHATMAELAGRHWLATMPLGYVALDREACEFFLRSRDFSFPGMKVAELFGVTDGPLYEEISRNILHINGDDHRRLRTLVNPALTPRAVTRYRPAMVGFLEQLWAAVGTTGHCEFVEAFAKPYPSLVIATVMGAPLSDAPRLHHWSNLIQRQFASNLNEERELIEQAVVEFYDYAGELLAARRHTPGEDLISALLAAEAQGDRLSDTECVNLVLNILIGGVDTTQSQLAHGLRLFAAHPDQWRALAEDPGLCEHAVEEILRFEPITPFTARIAEREVFYRDVTFPEGTVVLVSAFTGNRDPGTFDAPERFDITRDPGSDHPLTFGAGIHYCLGANLARAELQEALRFLPARMPQLRLDGEPQFGSIHGIYGLERLPLAWDPEG
ncbi:MAG TPA: cytochrome P450 [Solirubrobacteraceae bacterium]|jgi:cytochrome P450|nr:cytochrome P450 [Solirubrobacteraceae bacterium]